MSEPLKILVVDDEPINIQLLTGLLKSDYKLMVAKNGERALKLAGSRRPDLILLDIMMPDMDGYEVCRRLKAEPETWDIPVIFITAMGEVGDETRGLELGARDYIRKPISPPILKARVRTQLALVQQQQELQASNAVIKSQRDRMEEELTIGREIQMSMMPLDFPTATQERRFSLFAQLEAARELGGDFYDFYYLSDSLLLMCIGDVSGKGVPAALFAAVAKTLIQSRAAENMTTGDILTQVNDVLSRDNGHCMFVTLFVAVCDINTGELTYTNAGHNPPYILNKSRQLERLAKRHGPVLGAMNGLRYRQDRIRLNPHDRLLLFTDGVTEAENPVGELYSEARLVALLGEQSVAGAESVVDSIMSSVRAFEAGVAQGDDITLMVFEYLGDADSNAKVAYATRSWSHLRSTDLVITWFGQFVQANGLDDSLSRKVDLVLDELLSNIIAYAYKDEGEGSVKLELKLKDSQLVITLVDEGKPFDPVLADPPDIDAPVGEREIGGLGIHLVRNLMDTVSYQRLGEKNVLSLSIAI